jgi:hypothetical protein
MLSSCVRPLNEAKFGDAVPSCAEQKQLAAWSYCIVRLTLEGTACVQCVCQTSTGLYDCRTVQPVYSESVCKKLPCFLKLVTFWEVHVKPLSASSKIPPRYNKQQSIIQRRLEGSGDMFLGRLFFVILFQNVHASKDRKQYHICICTSSMAK